MSNSKYLTVADAAKELGVNESRIRQLWRAGKLAGEKLSKRVLLISRKAVETYQKPPLGRPPKINKNIL